MCKSCPGACKAISEPFQNLCSNCGGYTKQFFEMPLSVYVLVSFGVSGYVLYAAQGAMMEGDTMCTSKFLYALLGFSVLNMFFAVYMQCKVWGRIDCEENRKAIDDYTAEVNSASPGLLARAGAAAASAKAQAQTAAGQAQGEEAPEVPPQEGKRIVPKEVVQNAFKDVFMNDFVVLGMFVLLCAMSVISFLGPATLDGEPKDGTCVVTEDTATLGYLFFGVAFIWSFAYLCCSCCSNKVTLANEHGDRPAE